MPFSEKIKNAAMVACGRSCCICHKFCGTKMEVHHIVAQYEGGTDDYDNAIPLCFDCHAEVKAYNEKHPKGIKYTAKELRAHRDNWYAAVKSHKDLKQKIPELKIVTPEDHKNLMLIKINSGKELINLIADKCGIQFDFDEAKTREEAVLIKDFQNYVTELIDTDAVIEPSERVVIGFDLNDAIKEIEEKGFWIFANEENCKLVGGTSNTPENFPILYIRLVHKDNEEIIHLKDGKPI